MAAISAVPWHDVETMILAGVGVRETARQLGLDEERVKKQATRKGWAVKSPSARLQIAQNALEVVRNEVVPNVPTAGQAMGSELEMLGKASRLSLARGLGRVARHVESLVPSEALEQAQNVKATVSSLAVVHAWEAKAPAAQVMVSVQMLGMRPDELRVEGSDRTILDSTPD